MQSDFHLALLNPLLGRFFSLSDVILRFDDISADVNFTGIERMEASERDCVCVCVFAREKKNANFQNEWRKVWLSFGLKFMIASY